MQIEQLNSIHAYALVHATNIM